MSNQPPGTEPALAGRRPRRSRRLRRPVRLAAAVLALAAVVGAVRTGLVKHLASDALGSALAAVTPRSDQASPAVYRPGDPVTILVMGTEKAPGYAGPNLTDSMMVLSFDPQKHRAAMLSVPRDMWVDIPGVGYQRINAAYEDGGPATAALTVERYIGVPVEYYALISYPAVIKLVNDLGGINVNVPYAINDTCFPNTAENRCTVLRIAKGPQHMNGQEALDFARERHSLPNGDLTREADQQLVLFGLRKALLQPGNLLRLPTIIGDLTHMVATNMPLSDLVQIGQQALRLPLSSIQHAVPNYANGSVSNAVTTGGADVLRLHPAPLHRLVTKVFASVLGHMDGTTVQVENGAPTQQDLATYFSGVLDGMGVSTLAPEQAAHTNHHNNEVFWNTATAGGAPAPTLAYILAEMLDTKLVTASRPASAARIVVVLGSVFPKIAGGPQNPHFAPNPPPQAAPAKAGTAPTGGSSTRPSGSAKAEGAAAVPGTARGAPGTAARPQGAAQTTPLPSGSIPGGISLPGSSTPEVQSPSGIEVPPRIGLPSAVTGAQATGAAGGTAPAAAGSKASGTTATGTKTSGTTAAGAKTSGPTAAGTAAGG